jgi:hypothetical protein
MKKGRERFQGSLPFHSGQDVLDGTYFVAGFTRLAGR